MSISGLLDRRLLFTVGKGGVGRTTVTLALALEAARRGKRVLAVELEGARGLERALGAMRACSEPIAGLERIDYLAIDGRKALEEYLEMIIPVRRLLRTIFDSAIYQYFVAAAPGLKELMAIGKIWFEADRSRDPSGAGPDLVLVDAPATGHSLQYLRMPEAAFETFGVGLVNREAERVLGLLRNPTETAVVVVSTAEEMPANETLDVFEGLASLGLAVGAVVVNQVHREICSPEVLERLRAGVADPAPDAAAGVFSEAVLRAEQEGGWAAINERNVARLRDAAPASLCEFPYVFCEEFGPEEVALLSSIFQDGFASGEG